MFWRAAHSRTIPIAQIMSKPGRNEPCPCGSGKKYKKCCLAQVEAKQHADAQAAAAQRAIARSEKQRSAVIRPDVDAAVDRALRRLDEGEGKAVESEITRLLEENPDHQTTNYAMGVYLAMVANTPAAAVPFLKKAAPFSIFTEADFNLAKCVRRVLDIPEAAGPFPRAVALCRAAEQYAAGNDVGELARKELQRLEKTLLETTPFSSLDAYMANARLFDCAFERLNRRQFHVAAELFKRVLNDHPKHVQSHSNLGLAYIGLGRRADALASLDRALELDPDYKPAMVNRRVAVEMREGEPFMPNVMGSVDYYEDRVRSASHAEGPDTAGV